VHLQLGSWRDRRRVIWRPAPARRPVRTCAPLVLAGVLAACASQPGTGPRLAIRWAPAPAAGLESVANIQVLDAAGQSLRRARLRVTAFMTHPGMAPVEATVDEPALGMYRARVRFTMAGEWIVRVQGTAADGSPIDLQESVRDVRPAE